MKTYDDNDLEQRLRELPAPSIPPELAAKLRAAIPPGIPAQVEKRRHAPHRPRWVLAALGSIAAAVVVAWLIAPDRTNAPPLARDVSPAFIITVEKPQRSPAQETRLCDILPPLPQSS